MDGKTIKYREKLYSQIVDAYGRVTYTYTTHHKISDRLIKLKNTIKVVEIILTAVSTVGFLATVITNQILLSWIGGITSAIALGITLYTKDFNLENDINQHKQAADELWEIREAYLSLITDFEILDEKEIRFDREKLSARVSAINKKYIGTDKKGYREAQKALKNEEEQTFNVGEVEKMLPPERRK